MLRITDSGFSIDQLSDILNRLSDGMKLIYGSDINLDADSPDAQFISIYGQEIADLNEILAGIYAFSDPHKAIGSWLDMQVKYVGISRQQARYSYVNAKVFADIGTILPSGAVFQDDFSVEWTLDKTVEISASETIIQFRTSQYGSFHLASGKELRQKTVTLGVHSIFTINQSKRGSLEESDEALLMRFLRSYSINNYDDREGLEAHLLSLDGIIDAKVYENYTNSVDSLGVDPHSINVVVLGGEDETVARAILRKKALGCGLQGAIKHDIIYQEEPRVVYFDRATKKNVQVKVYISRSSVAVEVPINDIKNKLLEKSFKINESVFSSQLLCGLSSSNYIVMNILLSSDNEEDRMKINTGTKEYAVISDVVIEVE